MTARHSDSWIIITIVIFMGIMGRCYRITLPYFSCILRILCGLNASDTDLLREDGKKQSRITVQSFKGGGGKEKRRGTRAYLLISKPVSIISSLLNQSEGAPVCSI